MKRLTVEKYGELLIKYNDEEYRSPCFGCECINKCNLPTRLSCSFFNALKKLKEYEDLEEQENMLIKAYEICLAQECTHCGYKKYVVDETWIRPEQLDQDDFYKTKEEAEKDLVKMNLNLGKGEKGKTE